MKKYFFQNPYLLIFYSITATISAILGMSMAFVMSAFVNLLNGGTVQKLISVFFISFIWLISYVGFDALYAYLKNKLIKNINTSIRQDLFKKIIFKNVNDYNKVNTASYIADLNNNIENLSANYFKPILDSVFMFSNLIGAFVGMLIIDISTIYMIVILVAISLLIPVLAKKHIEKRSQQYIGGVDEYNARLKDYLDGFMTIKTFSLADKICAKHNLYNEDMESKKLSQQNLYIILRSTSIFLGIVSTIIAMAYGVYLTLIGRVEGGAIVAMGHLIGNICGGFEMITGFISELNSAKPIIERYEKIIYTETVENDIGDTVKNIDIINIDNLSFEYSPENKILTNLKAKFEKGKRYAIVGESGSGKSTLLNLLMRYYDNYTGQITLNNKSIDKFTYKSLYENIGYIGQNLFLFEDTILNNLTLYRSVSEAVVEKAIKISKLDDYINSLPSGINTIIKEGGQNLSEGQKQRFALARAYINNPQIYLLDEFTSNLDMQTSTEIENSILEEQDKIIIHITHKLIPEMLKKYDEIMVLRDGHIIEAGSYNELMDKKDYFYSLQYLS